MVRPSRWASFYHHRSALNILSTVDSLVSYLPCQYCRHRRVCPQKEVRPDAHPPGGRIGFGSKALEVKRAVQSTRCRSTLCVSGELFRGKWNTHFILLVFSTSSRWLLSLAPLSIPCWISHLFFDGCRPSVERESCRVRMSGGRLEKDPSGNSSLFLLLAFAASCLL